MYHLHNLEQVILIQLLQAIGEFVHIHLYRMLVLRIEWIEEHNLTFFSVRFFFLALSSPAAARLDLRPFSSPGTEPDSRNAAKRAGLGLRKVYTHMRISFDPSLQHTKKRAHNLVLGLVTLLGKVQVVLDLVCFIGHQINRHVKLTPSLFMDAEWGFLESCCGLCCQSLPV